MQCADSGGQVLVWLNTVWPKCISAQLLQEAKLLSAMLWGFLWPLADEIVFKAQFPVLKCLEIFFQVNEFMAVPFPDQNLI